VREENICSLVLLSQGIRGQVDVHVGDRADGRPVSWHARGAVGMGSTRLEH
jgi:hypothetical protein